MFKKNDLKLGDRCRECLRGHSCPMRGGNYSKNKVNSVSDISIDQGINTCK